MRPLGVTGAAGFVRGGARGGGGGSEALVPSEELEVLRRGGGGGLKSALLLVGPRGGFPPLKASDAAAKRPTAFETSGFDA